VLFIFVCSAFGLGQYSLSWKIATPNGVCDALDRCQFFASRTNVNDPPVVAASVVTAQFDMAYIYPGAPVANAPSCKSTRVLLFCFSKNNKHS
jgi:hypothetical protein